MQGVEFWKSKITEYLNNAYIEKPEEADYSHLYDSSAEILRGILSEKMRNLFRKACFRR